MKQEEQSDKLEQEIVLDYEFLGGKDDEELLAVQISRDRRIQISFAHAVLRRGMVSEHGAKAMVGKCAASLNWHAHPFAVPPAQARQPST